MKRLTNNIIERKEYDFLRTNIHLGQIIFLLV